MIGVVNPQIAVCLGLTSAISRVRTVEEIYTAALAALTDGIGVSRSAVLLFDYRMSFVAVGATVSLCGLAYLASVRRRSASALAAA